MSPSSPSPPGSDYRPVSPNFSLNASQRTTKRYSFVGTPDYLAPEVILGTGHGKAVDWWSLGVLVYEWLVGIPPFNAESPKQIFENILNRTIYWPQIPDEMSQNAYDLINKLLNPNVTQRLGCNGAEELKSHPFFAGVNWDTLLTQKALFIPRVKSPDDTDYFDPSRKPSMSGEFAWSDDDNVDLPDPSQAEGQMSLSNDDFLNFSYKDLPNLEALTREHSSRSIEVPAQQHK